MDPNRKATMNKPKQKGRRTRLFIFAGLGLLLLLCLCGFIATLLFPSKQPAEQAPATGIVPQPSTQAAPTDLPSPSNTPEPTNTPRPTNTPKPTDTPEPTATPDPNLVEPGMYLVGGDIEPGLYQGYAGSDIINSCYWERLKDLTDSDSILANDNAIGQFYVEILPEDFAFSTDCTLRRLDLAALKPADPFPTTLEAGSYLVGLDIQAGMYRGEAGTDIMDSCYWVRLRDFTGGGDDIISNDNAVGQFFVQIQPGDYGFTTACELTLIE